MPRPWRPEALADELGLSVEKVRQAFANALGSDPAAPPGDDTSHS